MLGLELTAQSKILEFRKQIDIEAEIKKLINWMLDVTGFKLKDFSLETKNVLLSHGITVVYQGKYTLINPYFNTEHKFTFVMPKFINEYYMLINGMRYAFIYSFVDKALTRFGSGSTDAKLSNLYVRADIRNIFSKKPLQYWAKNYSNNLLNFIFAYYYIEKELQTYDDILLYILNLANIEYKKIDELPDYMQKVIKQSNKYSKYLVYTIQDQQNEDIVYFVNTIQETIYELHITNEWHKRLFVEFKPIKQLNMEVALLNKKTIKQGKKVIVFFKTIFDLFTLEMLDISSVDEFVRTYLLNGYIKTATENLKSFTNIKTKRVMIKLFLLHPLIRQIMRIIYEYYLNKGETLAKKHSITLSILHKILQIELAEDKIKNPIAEIALNSKISYVNKFALKRNSQSIRLVNNMLTVLDVVATPETKKVGSVNWLVFGYDGDIE